MRSLPGFRPMEKICGHAALRSIAERSDEGAPRTEGRPSQLLLCERIHSVPFRRMLH